MLYTFHELSNLQETKCAAIFRLTKTKMFRLTKTTVENIWDN